MPLREPIFDGARSRSKRLPVRDVNDAWLSATALKARLELREHLGESFLALPLVRQGPTSQKVAECEALRKPVFGRDREGVLRLAPGPSAIGRNHDAAAQLKVSGNRVGLSEMPLAWHRLEIRGFSLSEPAG